ncbi:MAG: ABC transporter substrate-binding protein [Halochromatium sp.]|uniref:ABC transporter substrate-binding protein n=1 Tax=Halochromatium sp. TaxID=2049430 RepID=UPI00397A5303
MRALPPPPMRLLAMLLLALASTLTSCPQPRAATASAQAIRAQDAGAQASPSCDAFDDASASCAPQPSVVSTNLCADLLLLRLGDPGQIRSVSRQAHDSAQSPVAERAARYPANRGAVEELLYYQPEIALTYLGWSGRPHAELLAEQGIRVVPLPYPRALEDALAMTLEIARAIDREAVGEQVVAEARARIAALSARAVVAERPPRALYLRPNGGTAGSETYVDALLGLLGLRNLAAEQGIRGWGRLPLERLLADPPDLFLLGYFDQAQPPSKSRYGRHPLFADLLEQVPSIRLPSRTAWGCGGLELIDAAEWIAARLDTLEAPFEPIPGSTAESAGAPANGSAVPPLNR